MPGRPVIVGVGQLTCRSADDRDALDLLERVTEIAVADAGGRVAELVDSVCVLRSFWRHTAPAAHLAGTFGFPAAVRRLAPPSGNHAQALINDAAARIAGGELRAALVVAAEASHSAAAARRNGSALTPRSVLDGLPDDEPFGEGEFIRGTAEGAAGITMPAPLYAMIESALRAKAGMTVVEHRRRLAELGSSFSAVAATNRYAWRQRALSVDELLNIGPDNRLVTFPYTTRLISDWTVDQAAAVLLCEESLLRHHAPDAQPVYMCSATDSFAVQPVSERPDIVARPQITITGQRALQLAGITVDDLDAVDLYSCFPAAVQVQASALGLQHREQLTVTGGMAFAGGPVNSYALHSTATMVERLRVSSGHALLTSVGGVLDKQSMTVLSTTPATDRPFQREDLSGSCEEVSFFCSTRPDVITGVAEVIGSTVTYSRDAASALFLVESDQRQRTIVTSTDLDVVLEVETVETVGRKLELRDGAFGGLR